MNPIFIGVRHHEGKTTIYKVSDVDSWETARNTVMSQVHSARTVLTSIPKPQPQGAA